MKEHLTTPQHKNYIDYWVSNKGMCMKMYYFIYLFIYLFIILFFLISIKRKIGESARMCSYGNYVHNVH